MGRASHGCPKKSNLLPCVWAAISMVARRPCGVGSDTDDIAMDILGRQLEEAIAIIMLVGNKTMGARPDLVRCTQHPNGFFDESSAPLWISVRVRRRI